jgi:hypothetical protein
MPVGDGLTSPDEACLFVETASSIVAGHDVKDDKPFVPGPGLCDPGVEQGPPDASPTKPGIHPHAVEGAVCEVGRAVIGVHHRSCGRFAHPGEEDGVVGQPPLP